MKVKKKVAKNYKTIRFPLTRTHFDEAEICENEKIWDEENPNNHKISIVKIFGLLRNIIGIINNTK